MICGCLALERFTVAAAGNDGVEIVISFCDCRCCIGPVRLADHLADCSLDFGEEGSEVGLLAVAGDRHVGRNQVEPDSELGAPGRQYRAQPAAIDIDIGPSYWLGPAAYLPVARWRACSSTQASSFAPGLKPRFHT